MMAGVGQVLLTERGLSFHHMRKITSGGDRGEWLGVARSGEGSLWT